VAGMLLRHCFGEASVAPTAINSTGAINDALSLARRSREGAGSCPTIESRVRH
jgi:hypothetical protein